MIPELPWERRDDGHDLLAEARAVAGPENEEADR